jgi:hypothetical protein
MTYAIFHFLCVRCRVVTPHEMNETGQKARCLICLDKQARLDFDKKKPSELERHLAALDGMGNRGPR